MKCHLRFHSKLFSFTTFGEKTTPSTRIKDNRKKNIILKSIHFLLHSESKKKHNFKSNISFAMLRIYNQLRKNESTRFPVGAQVVEGKIFIFRQQ